MEGQMVLVMVVAMITLMALVTVAVTRRPTEMSQLLLSYHHCCLLWFLRFGGGSGGSSPAESGIIEDLGCSATKIMAIKKIDNAALSLQEEDNFLEPVSNMSRLRHPNIITLVGYCAEHGQRLLVYDYVGNGNLYDMLHVADERS